MRRASGLAVALTVLAVVGGGLTGGASAQADEAREKVMCSAKYQSAQRLRAEGKLSLARADLLRCAEPACPAFVSQDCKTWLAEVEAELPTLVYAVLDSNGGDLPTAVVRVDGAIVPTATDGLGHALDPGTHVVEASAQGESLQQQVVVRVGERSRRIELRLPVGSPRPGVAAEPANVEATHPPAAAYVLGGLGVVAIAAGSLLWVTGSSAAKTYNDDCQTTSCSSSQRDNAQRQLVAGDIAWGVGLAAGIGAVAVVLVHGRSSSTPTVAIGPSGVTLKGTF